jgi:hypothetical protein
VRDDQCEDRGIYPRNTYGGFGYRVALRHGPQTVRGFTAFLAQYEQSHQPPVTAEEKNDLYVEALAAGARVNLSCVADALRWPISDDLRQRMAQLYGARNPDCEDQDHDGYTPLQGDCDDRKASIHPGARETLNHLDDNCDGTVDERMYHNAGSTITAPQKLTLPADVQGISGGSTAGVFQFHLPSSAQIQIEICQDEDLVSQVELSADGRTIFDQLLAYGKGCSMKLFALRAGTWYLGAALGSEVLLHYTLTLRQEPQWPLPPWARTAPPQAKGRQWVLRAPTAIPHLAAAPTAVRFWVSGQGYVGTVPYSRNATFTWTLPAGVDPVGDDLTYRAQVLAGGVPVYEVTPPRAFVQP